MQIFRAQRPVASKRLIDVAIVAQPRVAPPRKSRLQGGIDLGVAVRATGWRPFSPHASSACIATHVLRATTPRHRRDRPPVRHRAWRARGSIEGNIVPPG
ncbi:MAG: hypothetical protein R3D84_15015 [Paracoccaceae bacterium]